MARTPLDLRLNRRELLAAAAVAGAAVTAPGCGTKDPKVPLADTRGPDAELPFITPEDDFYIFWKYDLPAEQPIDSLTLTIGAGPDARRVPWSEILALPTRRMPLTLTCDGNGYLPSSMPLAGRTRNWSWRFGAIGTAEWDVIALPDLFELVGMGLPDGYLRVGARDGEEHFYPRQVVEQGEILLAVAMNGAPLPHERGFPGRLLAPGQYGVPCVKWVSELGPGEPPHDWRDWDTGTSHYLPVEPVAFATSPLDGATVTAEAIDVVGAAYAGRHPVREVLLWLDDGMPVVADLIDPARPFVWSRWRARLPVPPGRHRLRIACVDAAGRTSRFTSPIASAEPVGWGGIHELTITR